MPIKTSIQAALILGLAAGVPAGMGSYTFFYAQGLSYLTNDHVMQEYYDAWEKSSHHGAAVCNDCHTPHNRILKYVTKAENGYHHSLAFTMRRFHEPIQIKARNRAITEQTCRYCHQETVQQIDRSCDANSECSCIRCHNSVGHMK